MRYLHYDGYSHPHRIGPDNKQEFKIMVAKMPEYRVWCEDNVPKGEWQEDWNEHHALFFVHEHHATLFKMTWDRNGYTLDPVKRRTWR